MREREGPSPQGWEGEGLCGVERSQDSLDHSIGIAENIVVPEAEYFPVLALKLSRSACVRCVVGMLTTIDFDHQLVLGTGEVDDEIAQRMLRPKLVFHRAPIAQSRPHAALGVGRGPSQPAGFLIGHRWMVSAIYK
jgi:hypothetical protein